METKNGRIVLYWAARNGHDEIVKLLLSKGVGVDAMDIEGWTMLHLAAEYGYNKVV